MSAIQSKQFYVANSRDPRRSRPIIYQRDFPKNIAGLGGFQHDLFPLIVFDKNFDLAPTDNIERVPWIAVIEDALSRQKLEQFDPLSQSRSFTFATLTYGGNFGQYGW